jgi:hypothetical protein
MIFKVIVLFIILVLAFILISRREGFLSYKRCNKKELKGITREIFDEQSINKSKTDEYDLYIPCGYNGVEKELADIRTMNKNLKIFGIDGCDKIVAKNNLWRILCQEYGFDEASTIMPKTFLPDSKEQMEIFGKEYTPNKTFVCKKNVQRKKGILLSDNYYEIMNSGRNGYKLIQEFKHSLLINNRKFNVRVYLLIVIENGKKSVYIHKLNKLLYAKNKYNQDNNNFDENITNSYSVDKNIYETHPCNVAELEKMLNKSGINNKIQEKLILLSRAIVLPLDNLKNIRDNKKFQLFGVDVLIDKEHEPYILEINKGPDMIPKDDTDKKLKKKVLMDVFSKVDIIDDSHNDFKLIYSI